MSMAIMGLALLAGTNILARVLFVREIVEAYPDSKAARQNRENDQMYRIDFVLGAINVADIFFGIVRNLATGKSHQTQGSAWAWTRIVMWRPGIGNPYACYGDLARMLRGHGIPILWWGYDGDQFYFHVRQRQSAWALYLLAHGARHGRTWAEQAAERRAERRRQWLGQFLPKL